MAWFVTNGKNKVAVGENPEVVVKQRLKRIEIVGHSRMADAGSFYQKLTHELEDWYYNFKRTLIVDFKLEYINTSSSKWIFHLLASLQNMQERGGMIQVIWQYEEDDEVILETGEVLKAGLNLDFKLVPFEDA